MHICYRQNAHPVLVNHVALTFKVPAIFRWLSEQCLECRSPQNLRESDVVMVGAPVERFTLTSLPDRAPWLRDGKSRLRWVEGPHTQNLIFRIAGEPNGQPLTQQGIDRLLMLDAAVVVFLLSEGLVVESK